MNREIPKIITLSFPRRRESRAKTIEGLYSRLRGNDKTGNFTIKVKDFL